MLVFGAGATFSDIMETEIAKLTPTLAQVARTVGSPQIRHTGSIGGNIAIAFPAWDSLCPVGSGIRGESELYTPGEVRSHVGIRHRREKDPAHQG